MNFAARGKIARLPAPIREQVNLRLHNGDPATSILPWLNALPEVRAVIDSQFMGRPIRPQNISEWRKRGYRDWLTDLQASRIAAGILHTPSPPLARPTDSLLAWLAARYAAVAPFIGNPVHPAAWRRLRQMCSDIVRLRRAGHLSERLSFGRFRNPPP